MSKPIVLNDAAPAVDFLVVSPSDTADLTMGLCRSLFIGTSGSVAVLRPSGETVTFTNVPVGILPVRVNRVLATGTTASGLVALY